MKKEGYRHKYNSPLGEISLFSDGEALTGLYFGNVKTEFHEKELPVFEQAALWLYIYFRGQVPDFAPPLKLEGTPFRAEVWEILREIPYGQTVTYGEIAEILARRRGLAKMSARAVGGAVGHNPVSVIVPCHRVVGASGRLVGYGGGIDIKRKLLELEGADMKGHV